jgi:hypothetical protein
VYVIVIYTFFLQWLLCVCGMRLEVFVVIKIQIMVFWVLMPCSAVAVYQSFRGLSSG